MSSYFVIYSEDDENKVFDLTQGINNDNFKSLKQNEDQIDEPTKSLIIKCNFFVCFLSKNSSQLLLDIAKFARCIARKKVNVYLIPPEGFLKGEDQSFFNKKANEFKSIQNIVQVKYFKINSLIFTITQITWVL